MKKIYAVVVEYRNEDRSCHNSWTSEIFNDFESAVKCAEEKGYEREIEIDDDPDCSWVSKDLFDYEDDEVLIWKCHIEERVYSF